MPMTEFNATNAAATAKISGFLSKSPSVADVGTCLPVSRLFLFFCAPPTSDFADLLAGVGETSARVRDDEARWGSPSSWHAALWVGVANIILCVCVCE